MIPIGQACGKTENRERVHGKVSEYLAPKKPEQRPKSPEGRSLLKVRDDYLPSNNSKDRATRTTVQPEGSKAYPIEGYRKNYPSSSRRRNGAYFSLNVQSFQKTLSLTISRLQRQRRDSHVSCHNAAPAKMPPDPPLLLGFMSPGLLLDFLPLAFLALLPEAAPHTGTCTWQTGLQDLMPSTVLSP